jgi:hypothetical protein
LALSEELTWEWSKSYKGKNELMDMPEAGADDISFLGQRRYIL